MVIDLIILILAILLDPFVGISLAATIVVVGAYQLPAKVWLPVAFGLGLVADLAGSRNLGLSSAAMVGAGMVIYLVKEQFDLRQGYMVAMTGVIVETGYRLATHEPIRLGALLGQGLITYLIWRLTKQSRLKGGIYLK